MLYFFITSQMSSAVSFVAVSIHAMATPRRQ